MNMDNWGAGIGPIISKQLGAMLNASGTQNVCPHKPQRIEIKGYRLQVPELPPVINWFATGDYDIKVKVTNPADGSEMACIDFTISADKYRPPCTGFLCNKRK